VTFSTFTISHIFKYIRNRIRHETAKSMPHTRLLQVVSSKSHKTGFCGQNITWWYKRAEQLEIPSDFRVGFARRMDESVAIHVNTTATLSFARLCPYHIITKQFLKVYRLKKEKVQMFDCSICTFSF